MKIKSVGPVSTISDFDIALAELKEQKDMRLKKVTQSVSDGSHHSDDTDEITQQRHLLAVLNNRLMRQWERPEMPGAERREQELLEKIEKVEITLDVLGYQPPDVLNGGSAFLFRGGTSVYLDQNTVGDNSFGLRQPAELRKAERTIDLNANPLGTTTGDVDMTIDLGMIKI